MQTHNDNTTINTNSFILGAITSLALSHVTPVLYEYMQHRMRMIHLQNKFTTTRHYLSSKWNSMSHYIQSKIKPQTPLLHYDPKTTYQVYDSMRSFHERFGFSLEPVKQCDCNPCECDTCECGESDDMIVSHIPMQSDEADESLKEKSE